MRKGGLPLNRKFIILSLYFFSTICLFSVGFSSWTICMGDKLTASGNIVAENVISYQEVIDYNKDKDTDAIDDGIQVFNYFELIFVCGIRWWSSFILFHVNIQFSQHCL